MILQQVHDYPMHPTIVDKINHVTLRSDAVLNNAWCIPRLGAAAGDVVLRRAEAVLHIEILPVRRQERTNAQAVALELQTEQRLDNQPEHPAG